MSRFGGAMQAGYFLLAVRADGLAAVRWLAWTTPRSMPKVLTGQAFRALLVANVGRPGPLGLSAFHGWNAMRLSRPCNGPGRRAPFRDGFARRSR